MSTNYKQWQYAKRDEYYTPPILVEPIIKFIRKNSTVWCPFDTVDSEFVIRLKKAGHNVIFSHICFGQDFLHYKPNAKIDYIISNPPFTLKKQVFDRLYKLDIPFGMIMGLPILNYQEIGDFFCQRNSDLQLLIFDKKVSFNGNNSSFNSSYFCRNLLPKDLIFEHLENNNTRENFQGSRMKCA